MQSIKNTAVTIILLFLSYGVYQIITKPLPSEIQQGSYDPLDISEPVDAGIPADMLADMTEPISGSEELQIPSHLLKEENELAPSFDDRQTQATTTQSMQAEKSFAADVPLASTFNASDYPVSQASSEQAFAPNQERTFAANTNNKQLTSDSQIIPSTVMSPVATRPAQNELRTPTNTARAPSLSQSWASIRQLVDSAKFQDALKQLSAIYSEKRYAPSEEKELQDWLDALAAKVIYSSEHHLRSMPYIIEPGDTIGELARKWQVPAQLIYNVNMRQIPDPNDLQAGVEIKLIQGPFDAVIDSQRQQMTLYLDGLYAGRFTIQPGNTIDSGEFQIVDKSAQDHLNRPYWIALNNGGSIYASDKNPSNANEIALNLREAEEIFSILSATSKIKVIR